MSTLQTTLETAVADFLSQKNIAVTGVSRNKNEAANGIYRKLRDAGYNVYPINPNAENVEGDPCFPNLQAIAGQVDGVVIASPPTATIQIMSDCVIANVHRVWIHRSIGEGSMHEDAITFGKENDLTVIPGGCPMMFCEPVDIAHKCMRWWFSKTGKLPKQVDLKQPVT